MAKTIRGQIFWHSVTVPSHMWDGTVALCQNNLVYFNPLFSCYNTKLSSPVSLLCHQASLSLAPSTFSLSLRSPSRCQQASFFSPITKPLSPSLAFLSDHQVVVRITKPQLNVDSPSPISKSVLPIHSSHKPNTLDTHLTFHSITLSSNRDSQGFSRF